MHISKYRKQAGLTVDEIASKVGVSPSTVVRWEHGSVPHVSRWARISKVTGGAVTHVDWLRSARAVSRRGAG